MNSRRNLRLWGMFLAFLLLINSPALAREVTGRVTLVRGRAYIYTGNNKSPDYLKDSLRKYRLWKKLRVRNVLKKGDVLHVPARSRMDIVFHSERLRLDGPTLFQIKDLSETRESKRFLFFFRKKQTKKVSKFRLFFGRVMAKVNKLRRQDIHNLETPTAVMGVYGTSYLARSTPQGKGDLSVASGEVRVSFKDAPGRSHAVFAGKQLGLLVKRGDQVEIKSLPENFQKKLLETIEEIKEKPGPPLPEEGKKTEQTEESGEEVKEEGVPEEGVKEAGEDQKEKLEDLIPEDLPPLEEIFEDELFPEDNSGGALPDTGNTDGTKSPEIKPDGFPDDAFGATPWSPVGPPRDLPPSATERKKIRVKIRLDWTDLN